MKKLFALFVLGAAAITVGCGSSSLAPVPYVTRASSSSWAPQISTFNPKNNQSTVVNISLPTSAYYVSVTRDATLAAYTEYVNGSGGNGYNIYSLGTSGAAKQLTTGGEDWEATFSPDGKTIAYIAPDSSTSLYQVFTMNADGSNQTELYSDPSGNSEAYVPYFSPDGKTLSFYVYYNSGGAWVTRDADVKVSNEMRHSQVPPHPETPHPAAKGSVHAMVTASPTASGWYTMSLTGTAPTLVFATADWWGSAPFSADGTKLIVTYYNGTTYNIGAVAPGDSSVTALTTNTGDTIDPSPYGGLILYSVLESNSSTSTYSMNTDGSNQTKLIDGTGTSDVWSLFNDTYWGD